MSQNEPQESLIPIRYCINDNNFIPGPTEKENLLARKKPDSFTFLKKSNHPVNVQFKEGHLQDYYLIEEDIYVYFQF